MQVLPCEEIKTVVHHLCTYVNSYAIALSFENLSYSRVFQAYNGYSFSYLLVKLLTHDKQVFKTVKV